MSAIPWAGIVASNPRRIGLISAPISLHVSHDFRHDFCHDRATIRPRSGVNHAAPASSIAYRSMEDDSAPIPRHLLLDRGSIAPRSWSSSTIVHRRPITPQANERLRSRDRVVHDSEERPPSDRVNRGDDHDRNVLRLMKIQRSRFVHVAQGRPCDYFTYSSFRHVFDLAIAWTRVHAISAALIRSDARQAATSPAINIIVREHSPTRIKRRKRTRLNRGKDSPINYPFISSLLRDTWRPTRAPTWPPCHLARLLRGPHASCHVASAPRRNGAVDPRATWVRSPRQPRLGPLATSAAGNFYPFFAIFN